MPTDPYVAWLIALVVTTLYGWWMHTRGRSAGSNETASFIINAIIDSKKMTLVQISKVTNDYYNKQNVVNDEE